MRLNPPSESQVKQVLELIAEGHTLNDVASRTGLSYHYARKIAQDQLASRLRAEASQSRVNTALDPAEFSTAEAAVKFLLAKGTYTLPELAEKLQKPAAETQALLESYQRAGWNIHVINDRYSLESAPQAGGKVAHDDRYRIVADSDGRITFGATSDNHLGSKYSRLDALEALYDRFAEAGVRTVFNAGNWIDGEARFNRYDLLVHGMHGQVEYFAEHYPKRPGITTYFVAGDDHEGWYCQREGVDIGRYAEMIARENGRNDLVYLGYMESYIDLCKADGSSTAKLLVCHPGGGSAYAVSYTSQKSIEAYDGGEKPAIALYGHYHKLNYTFLRNVHAVQTGCTEDQTPFMRKKKLSAHLGGVLIDTWLDSHGAVARFRPEFITFFDRGYYQNQWNLAGPVTQHKIRSKK